MSDETLLQELAMLHQRVDQVRRAVLEVKVLAPSVAVDALRAGVRGEQAMSQPARELLDTVSDIDDWCARLQAYLAPTQQWHQLSVEQRRAQSQALYGDIRLLAVRIPGPAGLDWLDIPTVSDISRALRKSLLRICTLLQKLGEEPSSGEG